MRHIEMEMGMVEKLRESNINRKTTSQGESEEETCQEEPRVPPGLVQSLVEHNDERSKP